MPRRFSVLIEQDEDGLFVATVPALPGCHTQARTLAELDERVREAIALCLEVAVERGLPIEEQRFIGAHQIEVA